MFLGIILLSLGVLMILERLGIIYGPIWDYLWPVVLVALGLQLIVKHRQKSS